MKKYLEPILHLIFWILTLVYFLQTGFNYIRTCKEIKKTNFTINIESTTLRQNQGVNDWHSQNTPLQKKIYPNFLFYAHSKNQHCDEFRFYEGLICLPLSIGLIFKFFLGYGIAIYLIPKYLNRKKIVFFLFITLGFSLGLFGLELGLDYLYIFSQEQPIYPDGFQPNNFKEIKRSQISFYPFFIGIAFMYRFAKDWWIHQKFQEKLSQERLHTELNFLKSQINPHFLFNTLNNLYGLALTQHADKTAEGIAKLAQQMRYMLYESDIAWIELEKEIAYIQTFISLQKLRFSEDDQIFIHFQPQGDYSTVKIAPMLLIPFVENAFKHSLSLVKTTEIDINLEVINNRLIFKVKNTLANNPKNEMETNNGLGLQNVKRRLELLYPHKFHLDIQKSNNYFEITLELNL